jgi:GntP family gluconate:H+ symporter
MPGPIGILLVSVVFIVVAIGLFRLQAFFALMLSAVLVAVLASSAGPHRLVAAVASVTKAFGATVGQVGFTLALAAVIGISLMESGAADKIVRRLIAVCGESRVAIALMIASFVLSAPVFIDTVFMLLLPLARALSLRTGKDYMLYVLAVGAGGIITNGTVPPAPGPLFVAEAFKLNLFAAIAAGMCFGLVPAVLALILARKISRRLPLDPRGVPGASLESLQALAARPESELPNLALAVAPVLIPLVLIAFAATLNVVDLGLSPRARGLAEVFGDKNIALLFGALVAVVVHVRAKRIPWRKSGTLLSAPLEMAGVVILIIGAGSAYGDAIKRAGLDSAVKSIVGGHAINYVILGWTLAAVMRVAQGSATVAMITASAIVTSVAGQTGFGIHPMYVLLAIGYGSKALSWMNDAGFWLICRVGGLPQNLALRTWSVVGTGVSLVGLAEVWLVSNLWPNLPFLS